MRPLSSSNIVQELQKQILSLQGIRKPNESQRITGLAGMEEAFRHLTFPTGAIHELVSHAPEDMAATNGFIAAVLSRVIPKRGICIWVSIKRTVFPSALKTFGINPERVVFIDLQRQKDALWAVEEALKCNTLSAVVGELSGLSFTESRRLQLAVEESKVTGFIHRYKPRTENTVACVTRWKIRPLPTDMDDGLPGVGFPRWHVQLLKVRNGIPGSWNMEWHEGAFRHVQEQAFAFQEKPIRKTA